MNIRGESMTSCMQHLEAGKINLQTSLGARIGNNSHLASNLCVFNRPKRIQTPYSLFRDFGANKTLPTHWSGVSVQVWVQVLPLQVTWQSFLYSRRQSKVLTAKSMAELLLQRSCTARASKTGKYKQRVFPSLRQSNAVAARSNLHV